MKLILTYLKPYRLPALLALILTIAEMGIDLVLPVMLAKMINEGVLHQDLSIVMYWGTIMIGISLIAFLAGLANSFYGSFAAIRFSSDLRTDLFNKVQNFSYRNMARFPASALVTRFTNDIRQIQNTLFMGMRIMAKAPLTIIGSIIMAFLLDAKIAVVFLITVPAALIFLFWVLKKAGERFNTVQENVDEVNQVMQENLSGMKLIRAFVRRKHEEKRFKAANRKLADETRNTFRFVEASMPLLLVIMNATLLFILWFGHRESVAGNSSIGDVVAIINYALRISIMVSTFTFITLAISRAKASVNRVDAVLSADDQKPLIAGLSKKIPLTGSIEFNDVSFAYPDKPQKVLNRISFKIKTGERIAIMGTTGTGKTTLFELIPRLFDPDEGVISIDGSPVTEYDLTHLRKSIGFVPQEAMLFSGTIRENILFGKENATDEEMEQAAKDAQIHDLISNLESGYETVIGQRGVNLSGGQKQRISIARALIAKPLILMLDDSTSALDTTTESKLLKALDKYECTTLLITQKIRTAKNADRVMLLDGGKAVGLAPHKELLAQSGLYQSILESQAEGGALRERQTMD
ncbi:ABC transporter ATP-binding protein [Aciduricibacillus chroicocephali]|uniref:ABC transporter ATP-binding protein n=1 Tax=Aciduricibacillus chroicocephali TaxID=3054939 RepID=A0ABY9KY67_9BACI|nr:ABC transporter ATP-binding protein [Bacillaceae bacterium 44XB]